MYTMVELGTLIRQAKTVRCGNEDYPILSMTMRDGLVFQGEKFKKVIASKDHSDYKVVYRNQLVVSFPIDEGVLASQRLTDAGIVSPAYSVWDIDQKKILPEFLEYALRCNRALGYYKAKLRGSTARRRSLPTSTLLAFTVPLPSMSEQEKILAVMHQIRMIRDSRKAELQKLDELIKARFVEMFGTEAEFEKWPCCTVGDVANVCVGVVIKPTQYYAEDGIPAFRSLNIGEMRVKDSDWVYFTEEGYQKNQKSIVRRNDVLVVRSGAPGTACVATEKYDGYNAVDIIIAHPDNNKVNSMFLAAFTNMPHGMNQIRERTGGAAQQHFNVGGYKAMRLIMPSIELQNRFAAFVAQVDKSKVVLEKIFRSVRGKTLSNFTFLAQNKDYALFAAAAVEAERVYAASPAMCAVGCRKALELAVKWVYTADTTMQMPYKDKLQSLIHEPTFRFAVDFNTWGKLPYIIKLGNLAVHTERGISASDALASLKGLFEFIQWVTIAMVQTMRSAPLPKC